MKMLSRISKARLLLIVLPVFIFSFPLLISAQTPPGGTLSITTTTTDDLVTGQPGPSFVFWYLISGYPSPSNPWLPVATANGTGTGTTIVAEGNYGIFQQAEGGGWRLMSFDCSNSGGTSGQSLPDLGAVNVGIINGETTNCSVSNKYVATGNLKIVVQTSGASGNFKFAVEHPKGTGEIDVKKVTVGVEGISGEKTIEVHADTPTATGSSDFLNSYTIKIGEGLSLGFPTLPSGWVLDEVICQRQDSSVVGTYDGFWAISPVPVEANKTTTCTFRMHEKVGTIEIYSNLSADSTTINNINNDANNEKPIFTYQLGGASNSGSLGGSLSIGAAGSLYYPLPYYLQVRTDQFSNSVTGISPRLHSDSSNPWMWGKGIVSVNPGIYYIQQNSNSSWYPISMTCVQLFNQGQELEPLAFPAPSTPPTTSSPENRIFIDEQNKWVPKCQEGSTENCCSVLISKFYKDSTNPAPPPPPPGTPPASPPYLDFGNPEKCSFGTTEPLNKQFNISLNNRAMASVPVSPGGKTVCIFNNTKVQSGSSGRPTGGGVDEPIPVPNPE